MNNKRKATGIFLVIMLVILAVSLLDGLPSIGDPGSAPQITVANHYIEHGLEDTNSPNLVTAVLADYRGFDTLFETTVMYLAGVTVVSIISRRKRQYTGGEIEEKLSFGGVVVTTAFRVLIPVILIYAMYVFAHGEVSLGGGFQAGALLAAAYTIDRIIPAASNYQLRISMETAMLIAGVGTFIYAFTGILAVIGGGAFLDYSFLPFSFETPERHSIGITLIETGVTICVMGTIIGIVEAVLERAHFNE